MISKCYIPIILLLVGGNVSAATCFNPKTECLEGNAARIINGVSVTLDCWRYRITYECRENSDNNCKQLRDQRCSQTEAKCKTMWGGVCAVQDETYSCPVEQCNEAGDINCGRDLFCVGTDCTSTNPTKNKNFDKAAASLAALNAAAEEIKKQNIDNPQIFVGKPMECSRSITNAKNCCDAGGSGWAEGAFLNCADDEKELAKAKEAGRVVEAGNGNNEYCYNEVLGVCTSYHRVYCVFDSKIARIVQHDGRKNQLGISFGEVGDDSAHPNCRGITPEELSRMKFDRMDFSELYAEIRKKVEVSLPTNETLKQKAGGFTYDALKEKGAKGTAGFTSEQKAGNRIQDFYERTKK